MKKQIKIILSIILSIILLTLVLYFLFASKRSATDIINNETFISVDLASIADEYEENSYRCEEKYIGKYVVFTGEVSYITEEELWVDGGRYDQDSPLTSYVKATCNYYKGVAENSLLTSLSEEDSVIIKGKIVEFIYSDNIIVETYSIEKN